MFNVCGDAPSAAATPDYRDGDRHPDGNNHNQDAPPEPGHLQLYSIFHARAEETATMAPEQKRLPFRKVTKVALSTNDPALPGPASRDSGNRLDTTISSLFGDKKKIIKSTD